MKNAFFAAVAAALLLVVQSPLLAHETDEAAVRALAQQEFTRLLSIEGVLDSFIEEGIKRIVRKQNDEAAREENEQRQALAKNLRPVDPQRDHVLGGAEAAVTLIEYSDLECPYCKRFHPTVIRLMEDNPERLRWVYRHFPLAFHNPGAQKQAEAAECVAELRGNDAFWEFIHAIYDRTAAGGNGFPLDGLRPLAEETGVDGDAFDECLDSGRMTARVREDYEDGAAGGVTGTPAGVLMNRQGEVRLIVGALPIEQLQSLVDELSR